MSDKYAIEQLYKHIEELRWAICELPKITNGGKFELERNIANQISSIQKSVRQAFECFHPFDPANYLELSDIPLWTVELNRLLTVLEATGYDGSFYYPHEKLPPVVDEATQAGVYSIARMLNQKIKDSENSERERREARLAIEHGVFAEWIARNKPGLGASLHIGSVKRDIVNDNHSIDEGPLSFVSVDIYKYENDVWVSCEAFYHREAGVLGDHIAAIISERDAAQIIIDGHGPIDAKTLVWAKAFAAKSRTVPLWNPETGELSFRGEVIRKVIPRADNVRKLLDVFQAADWPERIESPWNDGKHGNTNVTQTVLRETIRSLKENLLRIEFAADGKGSGAIWRELPTKTDASSDFPF